MSRVSDELRAKREKYIPHAVFQLTPMFLKEAKGSVVIDIDGKEYIDFAGGIGTMAVGHCHPKVVEAVKDQVEKYMHTCFHLIMYKPYVALAERLCSLAPGSFAKMCIFANSGAEGVENAVKIARYYTKKPAIIAFENAFHGRTLLTMTLTSKAKPYKYGFGPFAPEIYRAHFAYCYRCSFGLEYPRCNIYCADYLKDFIIKQVAAEHVAAVIAEPIQGEGGFITPPPGYFEKLVEICHENEILFICDEIQSGIARTGKMFAIENWKVEPDIVVAAKSLAAGMPLSAVIGKESIMNESHVGGLGGTYGGNPVCCQASMAVLDVIEEENILKKSDMIGIKVREKYDSWQQIYELIGEVRGLGPMLGLELVKDRKTKKPATEEAAALIKSCYEKGLIIMSCGTYGNVIRTLMPLVITDEQLERGLSILEESLEEVSEI